MLEKYMSLRHAASHTSHGTLAAQGVQSLVQDLAFIYSDLIDISPPLQSRHLCCSCCLGNLRIHLVEFLLVAFQCARYRSQGCLAVLHHKVYSSCSVWSIKRPSPVESSGFLQSGQLYDYAPSGP